MDTIFTPYNGMFAFNNDVINKTTTIAMKLNNRDVLYTHNLLLKKDLLENSISFYSKYILNNKVVFIKNYIKQKPFSISQKAFLYKQLTPDSFEVKSYARWLLKYADQEIPTNSILEFIKYDFDLIDGKIKLTDSTSLFKIKVSNADLIP